MLSRTWYRWCRFVSTFRERAVVACCCVAIARCCCMLLHYPPLNHRFKGGVFVPATYRKTVPDLVFGEIGLRNRSGDVLMYVCMYVCVSITLNIYVCTCIYTYMYMFMYIYIFTIVHVNIYICICLCTCIYIYIQCMCMYLYIYIYMHLYIDIHLYLHIYLYIYTYNTCLYRHTCTHLAAALPSAHWPRKRCVAARSAAILACTILVPGSEIHSSALDILDRHDMQAVLQKILLSVSEHMKCKTYSEAATATSAMWQLEKVPRPKQKRVDCSSIAFQVSVCLVSSPSRNIGNLRILKTAC